MHVEGGDAARLAKFVKVVIDHALHRLRDGVTVRGEDGKLFASHVCMVGGIERDQADRPARVQYDMRGMRISIYIGL